MQSGHVLVPDGQKVFVSGFCSGGESSACIRMVSAQ